MAGTQDPDGGRIHDLSLVPPNAIMIFALRPAEIVSRPEAKGLGELLESFKYLPVKPDFKIGELEQIVVYRVPGPVQGGGGPVIQTLLSQGGIILRLSKPHDWKKTMTGQLRGEKLEDASFDGVKYTRISGAGWRRARSVLLA